MLLVKPNFALNYLSRYVIFLKLELFQLLFIGSKIDMLSLNLSDNMLTIFLLFLILLHERLVITSF
ncbi:hypothetical protein CW304_09920 [Bacillus sp. UFRGS-B20]|nr:hypothetical protein CW304_09920 [Bacillus sp. UFRGS-B20]